MTSGTDKTRGPQTPNIEDYLVKDPERFAANLARMVEEAGKVASAWSAPREAGKVHDALAEPLTDMVRTFSKLTEYWLSEPSRALEAQTRLYAGFMEAWSHSLARFADPGAAEAPASDDKRFRDPDWGRHAFFDFLRQTYLVTSRWANDLVTRADDLDEHTRHKAAFYVTQITEALSPSNFVLTNPELFRETVESNGENLVRGLKMLAEDIAAGKGDLKLRQSDASGFEIGTNIAASPGKVIARSDLAEIIQYQPTTKSVLKRPLLICPPWINKFYILDLNPQKSFIRWAVEQGHTVFVVSWVNPDERHARKDWEAYIREGLQFGLDAVEEATGEREVNAIGYCVGGTLLAAALALFAREDETRIKSATFFTTQVDFTHAGDLKVFVDEGQVRALESAMATRGYLEGNKMATAFNMLRASELIWPYVVNNYMRGRSPTPFDLLYWNSDSTRMSAANHSFYLRNCYLENNLAEGRMKLAGKTLSLADIDIPVYNLATREDHIAPATSAFAGSGLFSGPVEYVLAGSGHIAGVVNPPHAGKYQYWTGPEPAGAFEAWLEAAEEQKGSWWPHWQRWIESVDDTRVPARKITKKRKTLGDAPGTYVRARA